MLFHKWFLDSPKISVVPCMKFPAPFGHPSTSVPNEERYPNKCHQRGFSVVPRSPKRQIFQGVNQSWTFVCLFVCLFVCFLMTSWLFIYLFGNVCICLPNPIFGGVYFLLKVSPCRWMQTHHPCRLHWIKSKQDVCLPWFTHYRKEYHLLALYGVFVCRLIPTVHKSKVWKQTSVRDHKPGPTFQNQHAQNFGPKYVENPSGWLTASPFPSASLWCKS